jgi:tetratricopeptide (TPR) repeat protein
MLSKYKYLKNFNKFQFSLKYNFLSFSRHNFSSNFYSVDSDYVREPTDKIYPKVRRHQKLINADDLIKKYRDTLTLIHEEKYDEAFIESNLLLNESLTLNNDDFNHSVYCLVGDIQLKKDEYSSAADKYESAYECLVNMQKTQENLQLEPESIKNLLENIFFSYEKAEDYENALKTLERIINSDFLKFRENDPLGLVNAYENYGRIKALQGDIKTAISYYEKCLDKLKIFSDNSSKCEYQVKLLFSIGTLYIQYEKSNLEKIQQVFNKLYEILANQVQEDNLDEKFEYYYIDVLYYLAMVHRELKDPKESLKFALKLLKRESSPYVDDRLRIEILHMTYLNYFDIKDLNSAMVYLLKELDIYHTAGIINYNLQENKLIVDTLTNVYSDLFKLSVNYYDMIKNSIKSEEIYSHLINYLRINIFPSEGVVESDMQNHNLNSKYLENLNIVQSILIKYPITGNENKILTFLEKMKFLASSYEILDEKLSSTLNQTISMVETKNFGNKN